MAIQKVKFSIEGLKCNSCAKYLTDMLLLIRGVTHATIDLASLECRSSYDDERVSEERLVREISSTGYRVIFN